MAARKKKKKSSPIVYVFLLLVVIGLALVVVGMFVGQVTATAESGLIGKSDSTTYKLFDDIWGVKEKGGVKIGVSNTFAIISYIVAIVGLAILLLDGIARVLLKKKVILLSFLGVVAAAAGAVLILVSAMTMVKNCGDGLDLGVLIKYTYSMGIGVWLGFVGACVGAVGGLFTALSK